jgi:hypothetical protein
VRCSPIAASKAAWSSGEAERVVELEHDRAGQRALAARLERRDLALEQPEAVRERLEEALLLAADPARDERAPLGEVGVGGGHRVDHGVGDAVQERALEPEQHAVARRAAQDPAQHVAAALVRGQHAVADQEGEGARVVGDHVQRDVLLGVAPLRHARELLGARDDREEQIRVVHPGHALQHRG